MFPLLAIETSCDETAAAVLGPGHEVLANVVRSQIDEHALFGGVVPELASRCHLESVGPVVDEALRVVGCSRGDLQAVAATRGPDDLVGSVYTTPSAPAAITLEPRGVVSNFMK